jgi:tetratricopeptide (TPR) repeat protein
LKDSHLKKLIPLAIVLFALATLSDPLECAEKKSKATTRTSKIIQINEENVEFQLKNAEEFLKKGNYGNAFDIFERVYEYSKNVLKAIEVVEGKQKEAVEAKALDQKTQESLLWKSKRRDALKIRYREYLARSAYFCGYICFKRNDMENAGKYLIEALKNSAFSDKPDSTYVKALNLLAKIYALEGEL